MGYDTRPLESKYDFTINHREFYLVAEGILRAHSQSLKARLEYSPPYPRYKFIGTLIGDVPIFNFYFCCCECCRFHA